MGHGPRGLPRPPGMAGRPEGRSHPRPRARRPLLAAAATRQPVRTDPDRRRLRRGRLRAHSSSDPWLYSAGLLWENVVGLAAYVLILTFPTGRLEGRAPKLILGFTIVT